MRRYYLLPLLAAGLSYAVAAQEVTAVAAGSGHTNALTLDWTLGELVTHTVTAPGGYLTQGFHQPTLQVLEPAAFPAGDPRAVAIFPNPARQELNVTVTGADYGDRPLLDLLDMRGRLILTRSDVSPHGVRRIDVSALPSGVYQLRVSNTESALSQTFTVIKIK